MSVTPTQPAITRITREVDRRLKDTPPWKIVSVTAAATALTVFGGYKAYEWLSSFQGKETMKTIARHIPYVQEKLEDERAKLERSVETSHFAKIDAEDICRTLPERGWSKERILDRLHDAVGKARNGKNSGAYYIDNKAIDELIQEVNKLALRTNPLHTDLCPLIKQLENEVVSMCANMFKGDKHVTGNITTGGTDSIRHAVFTARERAKAAGIASGWEILLPETVHPAFDKAANEYCINVKRIPVYPQRHPKAFQVNVNEMKHAISSKTILAACSCPAYPHGMIDPLNEINDMLLKADPRGRIGLHADYCLGGFILPWMEQEHYGFDLPRVTSISCDTHKYGYTEKGTSVIMYRNFEEWHRHQMFVTTTWPGGIYATPTLPGSRSGRDIAATWAVMVHLGEKGYIREAEKVVVTAQSLARAISGIESLELLGNPIAMNIAFQSTDDTINIYDIKKEMSERGWYLAGLQKPAGIHFCVTAVHPNIEHFEKQFVCDLKESIEAVKLYPEDKRAKSSDASMYRSNVQIGEKEFVDDFAKLFWHFHSRVEPETGHFGSSNGAASSSSSSQCT